MQYKYKNYFDQTISLIERGKMMLRGEVSLFTSLLFNSWNAFYKSSFDVVFYMIFIIFLMASIYEFTMRYLIQFYTFPRLAFLFGTCLIFFLVKKSREGNTLVKKYLGYVQNYSQAQFYIVLSIFATYLFLSVNFRITEEFLRFWLVLSLVSYGVFKYYGNTVQFERFSFHFLTHDAIKLYIIFACITVFTITPFVNVTYLYNHREIFFPILIFFDIILLTFLMYELSFLNKFLPRRFRKK